MNAKNNYSKYYNKYIGKIIAYKVKRVGKGNYKY